MNKIQRSLVFMKSSIILHKFCLLWYPLNITNISKYQKVIPNILRVYIYWFFCSNPSNILITRDYCIYNYVTSMLQLCTTGTSYWRQAPLGLREHRLQLCVPVHWVRLERSRAESRRLERTVVLHSLRVGRVALLQAPLPTGVRHKENGTTGTDTELPTGVRVTRLTAGTTGTEERDGTGTEQRDGTGTEVTGTLKRGEVEPDSLGGGRGAILVVPLPQGTLQLWNYNYRSTHSRFVIDRIWNDGKYLETTVETKGWLQFENVDFLQWILLISNYQNVPDDIRLTCVEKVVFCRAVLVQNSENRKNCLEISEKHSNITSTYLSNTWSNGNGGVSLLNHQVLQGLYTLSINFV